MAATEPVRHSNRVEIFQTLEEEDMSFLYLQESSSDEDDLLFPTSDSGDDSDYVPLSSESDDDYEPPLKASTPRRRTAPGLLQPQQLTPRSGLAAPPPTTEKRGCSSAAPSPTTGKRGCSSAAPSPTTGKRGCSSLGSSATPTKLGKRLFSPTESEEDRWHDKEEEDSKPDRLRFMPARIPGPTFDTTVAWSPISLFQLFFSGSIVQKIIDNTNANAAKRQKAGKKFKWEVLTMKDFYIFLSILLYTGLVTVHNRSDYWRKKWPYNFSFPGDSMRRDRFEAILWSLHLSDPKEDEENEKKRNTAEYDKLFKLKPLYTEMVNACKAHFQPYHNLSIDERMVGTKGRISIKQYMKNKPTKWGYKLFVLADSSTGYTWNFFIYTGKSESPITQSLSYSAVMDLLPFRLLGGGYTLYTDNFYTSPALFNDLSAKNIGCCGTLRKKYIQDKKRIGFPQTQTNDLPKNAKRGDLRWIRNGKLLFVKWMDTREVTMCSTVHQAYSGQTVSRTVKEAGVWKNKSIPVPDSIVDYNRNMGGVDLSDALMTFYSIRHKTMKWYKTLFYHFVEIATVNSFLLHKELFKFRVDPNQTKPFTHKIFREQLAKEMLEFAEGSADIPPTPSTSCMPIFLDNQETRARKYCKRCHDAGRPRVKTAVICRRCEVPLCLNSKKNCFQLWHDGE